MRHKHGYRKLGRTSSHRKALLKNLSIALIQRESFDYTKWRQKNLPEVETIEELSKMAMEYRKRKRN